MLDGYVINLKSRPDRLAAFQRRMAPLSSQLKVEVVPGIDGRDLNIDDLRPRINPWNFEHLTEVKLRGVLGCALSHLNVWKAIASSQSPMSLIFEDDATFRDSWLIKDLEYIMRRIPPDADLVLLNDYVVPGNRSFQRRMLDRISRTSPLVAKIILRSQILTSFGRVSFRRWPATSLKTTESYMMTPKFAQRLVESFENNLIACDEHVRVCARLTNARAYELKVPIFKQFDRSDTNVQL